MFSVKKYYYLSGLPRSGNTALSSILNQNKNIGVNAHSPISDLLYEIENYKKTDIKLKNFPNNDSFDMVGKNMFKNYYSNWKEKYIIDRSCWGTPDNLKLLEKYSPNQIKIIVPIRDLREILASFIRWSSNKKTFLSEFKTSEEKCDFLMNDVGHIKKYVQSIHHLVSDEKYKNYYHLVPYQKFVDSPNEELKKIYKFLNIKNYKHNFNKIKTFKVNGIEYNDEIYGKDLHMVKSNVEKSKYHFSQHITIETIKKYDPYISLIDFIMNSV